MSDGNQKYLGNGKHEWELVTWSPEDAAPKGSGETHRLRVPGGWLYHVHATDDLSPNTVFVPMPEAVVHKV